VSKVSLDLRWAGGCLHPHAMAVQGASWRPAYFPALFAVLRHPRHGVTLFDTGYSTRFMQATERFPQRAYRWLTPVQLAAGDSAVEQLAREGVAAESVERIVLSHFHADHIAGARDFPNARFVASRQAWDAVCACGPLRATARGFLPQLLPVDFEQRATLLDEADFKSGGIGSFASGHDLFGDGSVRLIPLPGHARGQLGLLAETPGRRRFLIADAAWTTASYQQRRPHHRLAALVLDDDSETRRTLDGLHELWKAEPTLDIIPSHCAFQWRAQSLAGRAALLEHNGSSTGVDRKTNVSGVVE
jgi:glyoxylase-like metal-dependent hydrolase (beta-lactamase superfamily II)